MSRLKYQFEEQMLKILKSSENVKSRGLDQVRNENLFPQTILDTKLSIIGFSLECFTADFLLLFTENCQNLAFGWTGG